MNNLHKVLLGALLIKPALAPYALPGLEIEHFPADLQPVFAAMSGFWEKNGTLDLVALRGLYPAQQEQLLDCVNACESDCVALTRERVESWAQLVLKQAALAKFQGLALRAAGSLTAFEDLADLYSQMGEALNLTREEQDFQPIGALVEDYIRDLDKKPQYIPTGIPPLDRRLHLSPGNLFIIGGRPSAGKTACALQMACEMARRGFRVCFFSLETSPATLTSRIIANRLAVPLADVQSKRVPQSDLDCLAELHKLPLFIRSASGKSVAWIKAQAQRMNAQIVFIDYLQILATAKAKDRYNQITAISIALHEFAQSTGILVVALAQLNRNAAYGEHAASSAPTTADLKESGQLEQDADAVLLLANNVKPKNGADTDARYFFGLAKNKEGQTGRCNVTFDKEHQRFLEVCPRK